MLNTRDVKEFIYSSNLIQIKPDLRHYGFNNPNGTNQDDHGFEFDFDPSAGMDGMMEDRLNVRHYLRVAEIARS